MLLNEYWKLSLSLVATNYTGKFTGFKKEHKIIFTTF